jgi:ribonuclease P/MRP protein subunit POP7
LQYTNRQYFRAAHRIVKRPLLRPPITPSYAATSQRQTIYISASTPFLSAVKRVEKQLQVAEKRRLKPAVDAILGQSKSVSLEPNAQANRDSIYLRGTGKAINKVVELGVFLAGTGKYDTKYTTGDIGAVDDIEGSLGAPRADDAKEICIPETRLRKVSFLEIEVSLK